MASRSAPNHTACTAGKVSHGAAYILQSPPTAVQQHGHTRVTQSLPCVWCNKCLQYMTRGCTFENPIPTYAVCKVGGVLQGGVLHGVAGNVVNRTQSWVVGGVAAEVDELQRGGCEVEHSRAQLGRRGVGGGRLVVWAVPCLGAGRAMCSYSCDRDDPQSDGQALRMAPIALRPGGGMGVWQATAHDARSYVQLLKGVCTTTFRDIHVASYVVGRGDAVCGRRTHALTEPCHAGTAISRCFTTTFNHTHNKAIVLSLSKAVVANAFSPQSWPACAPWRCPAARLDAPHSAQPARACSPRDGAAPAANVHGGAAAGLERLRCLRCPGVPVWVAVVQHQWQGVQVANLVARGAAVCGGVKCGSNARRVPCRDVPQGWARRALRLDRCAPTACRGCTGWRRLGCACRPALVV